MTELTQEQVEELVKCSKDPVYFINNYVKFNHYANGLTELKLYEPQEKLIRKYHNNRFNILKAPRQIAGKSSTAIFYILHHIIFENDREVALVSHHINPSIHLLNLLKFSYENLPKWMQHGIIISNQKTFKLENGSEVIAASSSPSNLRGRSFSLVLLDELGYNNSIKLEDFFNSVFPIIHSNKQSKVIINWTLDYYKTGYGDKIWKDSEDGKNDFVRTEIKWYDIPKMDEKWKEEMIAIIGKDAWVEQFELTKPSQGELND